MPTNELTTNELTTNKNNKITTNEITTMNDQTIELTVVWLVRTRAECRPDLDLHRRPSRYPRRAEGGWFQPTDCKQAG